MHCVELLTVCNSWPKKEKYVWRTSPGVFKVIEFGIGYDEKSRRFGSFTWRSCKEKLKFNAVKEVYKDGKDENVYSVSVDKSRNFIDF